MIDFILYLFLNSLFIWGVNCLFSKGHVLEKVGDWLTEKLPSWVTMPLFDCAACQSSVYGTIGFYLKWGKHIPSEKLTWETIGLWIAYCLCLCGWNYLLIKLTNRKREVKISTDEDF